MGSLWVSGRDSKTQIVGLAIVTEMDPRTMGSMGLPCAESVGSESFNGLASENS